MPAGVHGQRTVDALHELAEVHRMEAVDVLVRVDRQQRRLEVEVLRERVLHQVGVDGGIGVEPLDDREDVLLGGVGRQVGVRAT